jgi:hypothetical protein
MALRAKTRSDEAEFEDCGGPTLENDNEGMAGVFAATRRDGVHFPYFFVVVAKVHPVSLAPPSSK